MERSRAETKGKEKDPPTSFHRSYHAQLSNPHLPPALHGPSLTAPILGTSSARVRLVHPARLRRRPPGPVPLPRIRQVGVLHRLRVVRRGGGGAQGPTSASTKRTTPALPRALELGAHARDEARSVAQAQDGVTHGEQKAVGRPGAVARSRRGEGGRRRPPARGKRRANREPCLAGGGHGAEIEKRVRGQGGEVRRDDSDAPSPTIPRLSHLRVTSTAKGAASGTWTPTQTPESVSVPRFSLYRGYPSSCSANAVEPYANICICHPWCYSGRCQRIVSMYSHWVFRVIEEEEERKSSGEERKGREGSEEAVMRARGDRSVIHQNRPLRWVREKCVNQGRPTGGPVIIGWESPDKWAYRARQVRGKVRTMVEAGTMRYKHLPANSFLALLPKSESIKTFNSHVEIELRAHKVFEELLLEKEALSKTVSIKYSTAKGKGRCSRY
ncbi:hypothetical protein B0H11DRAFT_1907997 [Mycena galericulata]|nr:hypothetical protein B0H11DRAFT_1907997 [Mycena galericulata]